MAQDMIYQAWSCKTLVWKGHQLYPLATTQIMSGTYFYCLRSLQTHSIALLGMISDNLSGAKGTTQSSAITWLSLDPALA